MGTVAAPIYKQEEWRNPNVVKVLIDRAGFALYFSRSPIPYMRNGFIEPKRNKKLPAKQHVWGFRHLGLYIYRRDFLMKFARLRPTSLEQIESLEQLRALENGYRIYVAKVYDTEVEVDTRADLRKAERYFQMQLN